MADYSELKSVKRLNCFEEICPSGSDDSEAEQYELLRFASEGDADVLSLYRAAGGLNLKKAEESKVTELQPGDSTKLSPCSSADRENLVDQKNMASATANFSLLAAGGSVKSTFKYRKGKNKKFRRVCTDQI